jgi:hypothetical protein
MRFAKLTPIDENLRLRFMAEAFNLWNHAAFGTIRTTLSNARIIQLGLKLEF